MKTITLEKLPSGFWCVKTFSNWFCASLTSEDSAIQWVKDNSSWLMIPGEEYEIVVSA